MRRHPCPECGQRAATAARWSAGALLFLLIGGCRLPAEAPPGVADVHRAEGGEELGSESAFRLVKADDAGQTGFSAAQLVYELAVLHVLIPRAEAAAIEKIWNFLREDPLDAETQQRLRQNGLRVGVGHTQWWEPIKAAIDAIDDHRVTFATPVRVPAGFPLSLELDHEPREQTLFYVGPDGILSGGTWPNSRNVLRVTYAPDMRDIQNVVVYVVPEVHQQQEGWEWVRTESGLWEVPRQAKQTFDAAGFAVTLGPGEFAVVAPSASSGIYGLLGGAFLTRVCEGRQYESYVFLRPEARQISQND